jgi:hypothetical protein
MLSRILELRRMQEEAVGGARRILGWLVQPDRLISSREITFERVIGVKFEG